MAFPLSTVLKTAPGLISAATDLIGLIRRSRTSTKTPEMARIEALTALVEQQARLIEELAVNNRNLVMAVRNNRIAALLALLVAIPALLVGIWHG